MKLVINGDEYEEEPGATIADVVARFERGGAGIAVALNGEVVTRHEWDQTIVNDGDRVEVLGAVAGG